MGLPEWYLIRAVHLVGNISNHGKTFIGPALKQFFVYLQRTDNCAEQLHIFLEQLQAAKYTILDVFIIRNIPVRAFQKPGQYRIRHSLQNRQRGPQMFQCNGISFLRHNGAYGNVAVRHMNHIHFLCCPEKQIRNNPAHIQSTQSQRTGCLRQIVAVSNGIVCILNHA